MPSFTIEHAACMNKGLVVPAHVGVTQALEAVLLAEGQRVPEPLPLEFKIDTGADRSVICPEFAQRLGLQPCGVVFIDTATALNVPCYEYAVRFIFPNNVVWQGAVIAAPVSSAQTQCLIGRDILAHGVLVYVGYHNLFSLSF